MFPTVSVYRYMFLNGDLVVYFQDYRLLDSDLERAGIGGEGEGWRLERRVEAGTKGGGVARVAFCYGNSFAGCSSNSFSASCLLKRGWRKFGSVVSSPAQELVYACSQQEKCMQRHLGVHKDIAPQVLHSFHQVSQ